MAKREITSIDFCELVTIVPGGTASKYWSTDRPAHSPNVGKQAARAIMGTAGETLAIVISYQAGAVDQEVEIPAANIAGIVRRPVAEPKVDPAVAKASAK
jgi:hypothetical protein